VIPPIISVDDHAIENPTLWERWLPSQYRDRAPRVFRRSYGAGADPVGGVSFARSGPEADFWLFEDLWQAIPRGMAAAGMAPVEVTNQPMTFDEMLPGCYDPKFRLLDMDTVNVERSLCFPNSVRFCGQVFLWMKDKELALACVKAYNDWLVDEWCGDSGGRLLPVGLIPLWDPHAAADEVRRNAARGVRAVAFTELPTRLDLPSIHDASGYWLPLFWACDETRTVVCIHIGSSSTSMVTSTDAPWGVKHALTTVNAQLALSDWLFSGHFARFDHLTLALSESQIGWMPFLYERVDRIWRRGNASAEVPDIFQQPPSEYAKGRVYGCFFEDTFGIRDARDAIGADVITFEMDYPHQDTTWPHTHQYAEDVMADLDDVTVYKVMRGNAIRMLDLPETLSS
jgi:predicted TIM-barrel fold metal-dependent hydrolase